MFHPFPQTLVFMEVSRSRKEFSRLRPILTGAGLCWVVAISSLPLFFLQQLNGVVKNGLVFHYNVLTSSKNDSCICGEFTNLKIHIHKRPDLEQLPVSVKNSCSARGSNPRHAAKQATTQPRLRNLKKGQARKERKMWAGIDSCLHCLAALQL